MSFTINFMVNSSESNKLNKSLTTITSVSGTLKNECSILSPSILCEGDIGSLASCNYMYIEKFKRYFFVTDLVSINNQFFEVKGRVDVLTTYANQIRNNGGIIARNTSKFNLYLDDGTFKVYNNPIVQHKAFPESFNEYEFMLAVAGS